MLFPAWGSRIEFGHLHTDDAYQDHLAKNTTTSCSTKGRSLLERNTRTFQRDVAASSPDFDDALSSRQTRQRKTSLASMDSSEVAPWIDPTQRSESVDVVDEGGIDATGTFQHPRAVRLVGLAERRDERGKLLPPALTAQVLYVAKDASGAERFSAEPFVGTVLPQRLSTYIAAGMRQPGGARAEPEYEANLRQVDPVRYQQLKGDWTVRRGRGSMFRRGWCRVIDANERLPDTHITVTSDVGTKPPRSQAQRIPIRTGRADFAEHWFTRRSRSAMATCSAQNDSNQASREL